MSNRRVVADFVLTLCLLIGVAAIVIGFNRLPKRWEHTTGKVLSSSVGDDARGTSRVARVEYTYIVDGISHQGEDSRRWFKDSESWHPYARTAARFVSRRPVGASTEVFYDPTDPSRSALQEPRYEKPHTYLFKILFGFAPLSQLVIALFYAAFFAVPFAERSERSARRWLLLVPALCWLLYGLYEGYVVPPNAIRIDLMLILPILLLTSVGSPAVLLVINFARRSRKLKRHRY